MKLAETQKLFWSLIAREAEQATAQIQATFVGDAKLSAGERVDIYANMYFWRILDAIREDFPHTAAMLGHELFERFVRDYLHAFPSENPSLAYVGRRLPDFLRAQSPYLSRADVAALAELEWARARVFEAETVPTVSGTALGEVPPEEIPSVTLKFIPALQVVSFDYDVAALWRQLENGKEPAQPVARPTHVVIWRPEFEVVHSSVHMEEAQALRLALQGKSFAEVCEAFASTESAVESALAAVGSWFSDRMVARVDRPRAS